MPWILAIACTSCAFDANYAGGRYTCTDDVCPSGLTCNTDHRCVAASSDDDASPAIDMRQTALTCIDPGAALGTHSGTTTGRTSTISSMCDGSIMNAPDAVYRLDATAGASYRIEITGRQAYAIAPCTTSPGTPVCIANSIAKPGNPAQLTTPTAGPVFVIVDEPAPASNGPYDLTVTAL